jgi:hypothetical protein
MATTFTRNGQPVTTDFLFGEGEGAVQVPFENLLVWNDATLAQYGVTKTVTPDVPAIISDRQFFQNLALRGVITQAEALAAVGPGTIPPAMAAFVAQLPQADQFAANMLLTGATEFNRYHPIVPVFGQLFGWSGADIDLFWTEAYQL